jgi:hypothetical protein
VRRILYLAACCSLIASIGTEAVARPEPKQRGVASSGIPFMRGVNYVSWTEGDYPTSCSWIAQTYRGSEGITAATLTTNKPYAGNGSLQLTLDIDPTHGRKQGEVFIDLRRPPAYVASRPIPVLRDRSGNLSGVNMAHKTLHVWVYCPRNMGDRHQPWGIQVFAKSVCVKESKEEWSSFYSNWQNIWSVPYRGADPLFGELRAGRWSRIEVRLSEAPKYGHMDAGFTPDKVALLGVKIAANDRGRGVHVASGSSIWIDNMGWRDERTGDEVTFTFEQTVDPIARLSELDYNSIAVVNTHYIEDIHATDIRAVAGKTHSDQEIIETFEQAAQLGLYRVYKPHIDVDDDTWRGDIPPTEEFFESYCAFIVEEARLAQRCDVNLLIVGTELKKLIKPAQRDHWERIVKLVRANFDGPITYAANWDSILEIDPKHGVCLWDLVDIAAFDFYAPLSTERSPSLGTLRSGWTNATWKDHTRDWVGILRKFSERTGKNIVFSECGYRSTDHAAREPWEFEQNRPLNLSLQARCYESMWDALHQEPWWSGFLLWRWSPRADAGGPFDAGFTPQGKPAEEMCVRKFKKRRIPEQPSLVTAPSPKPLRRIKHRVNGTHYCSKSGCPGHSSASHSCGHYCSKNGCPGHSSQYHTCASYCRRPGCPGHSSSHHRCW